MNGANMRVRREERRLVDDDDGDGEECEPDTPEDGNHLSARDEIHERYGERFRREVEI